MAFAAAIFGVFDLTATTALVAAAVSFAAYAGTDGAGTEAVAAGAAAGAGAGAVLTGGGVGGSCFCLFMQAFALARAS